MPSFKLANSEREGCLPVAFSNALLTIFNASLNLRRLLFSVFFGIAFSATSIALDIVPSYFAHCGRALNIAVMIIDTQLIIRVMPAGVLNTAIIALNNSFNISIL